MKTKAVKTSQLVGDDLDFAVAIAIGMKYSGCWLTDSHGDNFLLTADFDGFSRLWSPSTLWGQGGPLIDQHITKLLIPTNRDQDAIASINDIQHAGPSALIAAMRAVVAFYALDEVVPVLDRSS